MGRRHRQARRMEHSKCTLPSDDSVGENIYMFWSSDGSAAADGTWTLLLCLKKT
ncbi:hypothetical protein DPMN_137761 [Dreissena polymorpha]|uniref:Uncharacterized protein n=1 Tax=Dreissena polymorpha TaxID=45954 RepID=A0A9D4G3B7_DREPO|nr:hypothetical protein DPMN_137761 [Dreissena polymorpha]